MPYRRKTYDGNIPGGSTGAAERRDTFNYEGSFDQYAPTKRAAKTTSLNDNDALFAEDSDKDRYIVTYADLITLLLGLFIILYAISNVDSIKYQKMTNVMGSIFGSQSKPDGIIGLQNKKYEIKDEIVPLQEIKQNMQNIITRMNVKNSINIDDNERGITIHILGDILFPPGTAELNPNSKLILKEIASIIKKLPNKIRVEGHTDNVPVKSSVFPSNWHLSVARALNTAYYFISEEGLLPENVSIAGYAEYKPVDSNDSLTGRRNNRRVDITILKD